MRAVSSSMRARRAQRCVWHPPPASGAHLPILELSRALVVAAPSSPVVPTNVAPIRAEVRATAAGPMPGPASSSSASAALSPTVSPPSPPRCARAAALCTSILHVPQWPSFPGWGPLPGIRAARFRQRTDTVVGSVIEVQNDDGTSHVERITRWEPGVAVTFHLEELSKPLSALATHLVETWTFAPTSDGRTPRCARWRCIRGTGSVARSSTSWRRC